MTALELAAERNGQRERIQALLDERGRATGDARITAIRTLVRDPYGEYLLEEARRDDPNRCTVRPNQMTILVDIEEQAETETIRLDSQLGFASTDKDRHDTERIRPLVTRRARVDAEEVAQALEAAYPCPDPDGRRKAAMLRIAKRATAPSRRTPTRCTAIVSVERDHELREWRADVDASVDGPVITQELATEHGKDALATARAALDRALGGALRTAQKRLRERAH